MFFTSSFVLLEFDSDEASMERGREVGGGWGGGMSLVLQLSEGSPPAAGGSTAGLGLGMEVGLGRAVEAFRVDFGVAVALCFLTDGGALGGGEGASTASSSLVDSVESIG